MSSDTMNSSLSLKMPTSPPDLLGRACTLIHRLLVVSTHHDVTEIPCPESVTPTSTADQTTKVVDFVIGLPRRTPNTHRRTS